MIKTKVRIGGLVFVGLLAWVGTQHSATPVWSQSDASVAGLAYLPALLRSGLLDESPRSTLTPAQPTLPAATALPSQEPSPTDDPVVFSFASYGGLSFDMALGSYSPARTPVFTLYQSGRYIRVDTEYDATADRWKTLRFKGALGEEEMQDFLNRLVVDAEFFALPAHSEELFCATDGPTDRLYLKDGSREHRISVYGLSSYTAMQAECRRLRARPEITYPSRAPLHPLQRPAAPRQ